MTERVDDFKEAAINAVRNNKEILEYWKHSSNPFDRALAKLVFLEARGEM